MTRRQPGSTLFPYTTLFRSFEPVLGRQLGDPHQVHGLAAIRPVNDLTVRARRREPHLAARWKSTRLNSSHVETSYAVFCLKKKKSRTNRLWIGPATSTSDRV